MLENDIFGMEIVITQSNSNWNCDMSGTKEVVRILISDLSVEKNIKSTMNKIIVLCSSEHYFSLNKL